VRGLDTGYLTRYAHTDEKRQSIAWVEHKQKDGKIIRYQSPEVKADAKAEVREMDCADCHNRPTHVFELPERAVDKAMAGGRIPPSLPFIRKKAVEILRAAKSSGEILQAVDSYYRADYASLHAQRKGEIQQAARAIQAIYDRNVFPQMNVTWGTYINSIGHTDFPGCFRCHDDTRVSAGGKTLTQDCNACHSLLAMEEEAPKILSDLGK